MSLKGVLGRLVEARGNDRQLSGYVAVKTGIRRALDDWIPVERYSRFAALAADLSLATEIDCVFSPVEEPVAIRGGARVPTTRALGVVYREGRTYPRDATVHVFVSSRHEWAVEACAAGWYPVTIGPRAIHKPRVDHEWLGYAFGYPTCCVEFFRCFNDWPRWNTLAEATARSSQFDWRANCLAKHSRWMCLFHMPCSWSCPKTVAQATAVLDELRHIDAEYAAEVAARMRDTYLVVNEVLIYRLLGSRRRGTTWEFTTVEYSGGHPEHDRLSHRLRTGGVLSFDAGTIILSRGKEEVTLIDTFCDGGAIEVPMVLDFGAAEH